MSPKLINMKTLSLVLLSFLIFSFVVQSNANAEKSDIYTPIAFDGYDAISYFHGEVALKGNNKYQATYAGKKYIFVSEENQKLFSANPAFFLPQFGQYCSETATQQSPVLSDPAIYLIDQGRLFQFSTIEAKNNWSKKLNEDNVELIDLAHEGYDITTYFNGSSPEKGVEAYQAVYKGKRYIFVNKENQQRFAASPEQFLPKYDGYCAHSVSLGQPVQSQADIFVVDKGDLLFFSSQDAKNAWQKEPVKTTDNAITHWKYEDKQRNKKLAAQKRWKTKNEVTLFTF